MKIFPAVHYSMGGLWVDYERTADGGLVAGSPRNQQTNIPGLYAIGECDYQYHGANRLGANSLLSCIFSGLDRRAGHREPAQVAQGVGRPTQAGQRCSTRPASSASKPSTTRCSSAPGGGENPYLHPPGTGRRDDQGRHGRAAQRRSSQRPIDTVSELAERAEPLLAVRHRQLDQPERRLHQGPARHVPAGQGDPQGRAGPRRMPRRPLQARVRHARHRRRPTRPSSAARPKQWCDAFEENNRKWLKTTIATFDGNGEPQLTYEDVDTSLIPPRPRLYGLVGAEVIEEVWKTRQRKEGQETNSRRGDVIACNLSLT